MQNVLLSQRKHASTSLLFDALSSKRSMAVTALKKDSIPVIKRSPSSKKIEAYCVDSTGVTVTADSSVDFIYKYCDKLRKDKNSKPRPTFQFNTSNGSTKCTLTLPPGAVFQKLVGPLSQNNKKAKKLVCLDACKKLHQLGALDDHLLPICDVYCVDSTGATITAFSSVDFLYKYCDKLPKESKHKNSNPRPTFQFKTCNGSFECTVTLPPTAAFQKLVGPLSRNKRMAQQLACLDAGKKLHQLGALNDHLLPIHEVVPSSEGTRHIENSNENADGAGTTKRKELHGTVPVSALSGNWAYQKAGVTLQGYKLSFTCTNVQEKYDDFVLLIDAVLDKDVASVEIDLFLVERMVKAVVSPCGPIYLEAEQVEKAKRFHEFLFNGVFGKLFRESNSSEVRREFLLMEDDNSLWKSSNMYLLLPLESDSINDLDTIRINWKGIREAASGVGFFRSRNMPNADSCSNGKDVVSIVSRSSVGNNFTKVDVVHLANETAELETLKDMIVMAIHTGKLYSIITVVSGSSSHSPFDSSDFASFSEYLVQKYNIVLQHPEQPLLLLRHSHYPHNLLSSNINSEGNSDSKKLRKVPTYAKKEPSNIHLPPELLLHIDVPMGVLRSLYLLPSLMYRMESLMLASQLRSKIGFQPFNHNISSSLILEAITTSRCVEDFSLERLEHLGDSVLKYAVSSSLYFKFPEKNEGQLSSCRRVAITNATLHKHGVNRNVQCYLRNGAFDPQRWVAPGQLTCRPCPCNCEIQNSSMPFAILQTDDKSIVIGKACDSGHRWICSKTISDCVEALIGAYYVGGGLTASIAVLKWLGIEVEVDEKLVEKSLSLIPSCSYTSIDNEIRLLEAKLGYEFTFKGLLFEAITHSSQLRRANCSYERLEFLGDSVLDLLITWHHFKELKDIDPGELTELRAASVNNERFAQCAIKHKLEEHLQHSSELLSEQIMEYSKRLKEAKEKDYTPSSSGSSKAPGVLGDMVESIAAAILIDTGLNLEKVWEVFEPLLPIVTPDKLELPPVRELLEFLSQHGYFVNLICTREGEMIIAEYSVQLESLYLAKKGRDKNKKVAKGQAAFLLLKELEKQGIYPSKSEQLDGKFTNIPFPATDVNISRRSRDSQDYESQKFCDSNLIEPVLLSLNMEKGGPRVVLHQLLKKIQWPMPRYEIREERISANDAGGKRISQFVSCITLHIPNSSCIKLQAEPCNDKKSSQDSAALFMLYELEKRGICLSKSEKLDGKSAERSFSATDVNVNMRSRDGVDDESKKLCDSNLIEPVFLTLNMKKGGPRLALNQLCQKSQWPILHYELREEKISANNAARSNAGGKKSLQFVSSITLNIPNSSCIKLQGEPRDDKKSSQDSAALIMLYELQKQGRCHLNSV